jgi:hypothetical protein
MGRPKSALMTLSDQFAVKFAVLHNAVPAS